MAGHAPEFPSPRVRLWQWLTDLSDLRISAYMLLLALAIVAGFYLINRDVFN